MDSASHILLLDIGCILKMVKGQKEGEWEWMIEKGREQKSVHAFIPFGFMIKDGIHLFWPLQPWLSCHNTLFPWILSQNESFIP